MGIKVRERDIACFQRAFLRIVSSLWGWSNGYPEGPEHVGQKNECVHHDFEWSDEECESICVWGWSCRGWSTVRWWIQRSGVTAGWLSKKLSMWSQRLRPDTVTVRRSRNGFFSLKTGKSPRNNIDNHLAESPLEKKNEMEKVTDSIEGRTVLVIVAFVRCTRNSTKNPLV